MAARLRKPELEPLEKREHCSGMAQVWDSMQMEWSSPVLSYSTSNSPWHEFRKHSFISEKT